MKLDLLQPSIEGRVQKRQEAMKNRYNQNTKLRELPTGVGVYTRFSSNEYWQPATVIESEGQIVTLEFTDGSVLRRHKDNVRLRIDYPETIIDRTKQKIVEQQRLPEGCETMIDSPLNKMVPPLLLAATRFPSMQPSRHTLAQEGAVSVTAAETNTYHRSRPNLLNAPGQAMERFCTPRDANSDTDVLNG